MLAVSPGGWNRLVELEVAAVRKTGGAGIAPFMDRVRRNDIVTLAPFGLDDTVELVRLKLEKARAEPSDDGLAPFTEEAIKYVHEAAYRKPRGVIEFCGILIEDALADGIQRIGLDEARSILLRYGIQPPAEEPHRS